MNGTLTMFDEMRQNFSMIADTQVRARALKKVAVLERAQDKQTAVEGFGDLVSLTYGSASLNKAVAPFLPDIAEWIRRLSKI